MQEEDEVERVKAKIIIKIQSFVKWKDIEDYLNSTKEERITFIENELQLEADKRRELFAKKELDEADDLEKIKEKIKEI